MSWFLLALIPPILYAITNHVDKYMISEYFQVRRVGSLTIISGLISFFALLIILFFKPFVLDVPLKESLLLMVSGSLVILSLLFYFKAMEEDEATVVVPFYQTIPIFGFFLGYLFLKELPGPQQIFSSILIIIGALILSLEIGEHKIKFKSRVVYLMLAASLFYATNGVIFKFIAEDLGFWTTAFWDLMGKAVVGLLIYLVYIPYRREVYNIIKTNSRSILLLNSTNEVIMITADLTFSYATLLAPIALVMALNSFQPMFVFLFGVILTLFFPKFARESHHGWVLVQKIVAIVLMIAGSILIE